MISCVVAMNTSLFMRAIVVVRFLRGLKRLQMPLLQCLLDIVSVHSVVISLSLVFQSGWPAILAERFSFNSSKIACQVLSLPSPLLCTIVVPLCNMYSRFLFGSPDVKESHERHFNDSNSLKESTCCIGGMDFVTLVCIFISHYPSKFTQL